MARHLDRLSHSLDQFVSDVRSLWGSGADTELPSKVRTSLERMLNTTAPNEPWMAQLIGEGKPGRELYRDPDHGFILKGHIQPAGHASSPHDHGPCWVLYGVYQGEIEISTYRRTDDGEVQGKATLAVADTARVTPGVVRPYLLGAIHATKAVASPFSVVFRFLSDDLDSMKRNRYNLDRGTVSVE